MQTSSQAVSNSKTNKKGEWCVQITRVGFRWMSSAARKAKAKKRCTISEFSVNGYMS
eukprot:m.330445 g.330445  ORF g.330445 m.330445 type:complete len:57 (-) comp16046_c1_seq1:112-282(-)